MVRTVVVFALVILLVSGLCESSCAPTKCRIPGRGQRTLCGVGGACLKSHVYECSNSGKCCVYGYRKTCKKCNKLKCPVAAPKCPHVPLPAIPAPPPDPPAHKGDGIGRWNSQKVGKIERLQLQAYKIEMTTAAILYARIKGYKDASANLIHYLQNTGQTLTIAPESVMKDLPKFKQDVGVLLNTEAAKAYKHITCTSGSKAFSSKWNSFTPSNLYWFYALNGFSYSVTGVVTRSGDKASIK